MISVRYSGVFGITKFAIAEPVNCTRWNQLNFLRASDLPFAVGRRNLLETENYSAMPIVCIFFFLFALNQLILLSQLINSVLTKKKVCKINILSLNSQKGIETRGHAAKNGLLSKHQTFQYFGLM